VAYGASCVPRRCAIDTTTRSSLAHQKSSTSECSPPIALAVMVLSARRMIANTVRSSSGMVTARYSPVGEILIRS
jgi:hypothetical protein